MAVNMEVTMPMASPANAAAPMSAHEPLKSMAALALVSVNGKSIGVYSNVESLDKHYFRRTFKSAKGTLYEGTVCDFHVHSLVRFERKFGSKKAISQENQNLPLYYFCYF